MVDKFLSSGVFFNHERAVTKEPRGRGWRRALSASLQGLLPLPPRPELVANTSCSLGVRATKTRVARFRDGRTGTTPKAGVDADVGGARRRRSLRARNGGERVNRALRDARATGSWLAPQGQLAA